MSNSLLSWMFLSAFCLIGSGDAILICAMRSSITFCSTESVLFNKSALLNCCYIMFNACFWAILVTNYFFTLDALEFLYSWDLDLYRIFAPWIDVASFIPARRFSASPFRTSICSFWFSLFSCASWVPAIMKPYCFKFRLILLLLIFWYWGGSTALW